LAVLTFRAKGDEGGPEDLGSVPVCPAEVSAESARRIVAVARQAWEMVSGAEGYGRVDLRLDPEGRPWVLEVNPNPDLSDNAGLARMGRAVGMDYGDLLLKIVDEAMHRALSRTAAVALTQEVA
jgi:D-alanine-D-alanine ligase